MTQAFNTTTSMGRLTLNMLLSFAQFEREITGERIRDKVAASKRKGIWMGGPGGDHRAGRPPNARQHLPGPQRLSRKRRRENHADCNNSISYTTQTAEIKVTSAGEIVYSPTGDPALDITFIKCKM